MSKTTKPGRLDPQLRWTLDPCSRHLNHGSFGAIPVAVQAEQARLRDLVDWNPVRWFSTLPDRVAQARTEMANLLGVEEERMAFVLNASAGASVVYQSLLGPSPVDVMVTDHGYGAVTMGAQRLAARTGGSFATVAIPLSATAEEVIAIIAKELIRKKPTLLVIDQITSATGRAFPAAEICELARDHGVRTLVDGAHAPGVLADPVCHQADYWVGNLHKFWCSPRGAAVIVARDGGQELFPVVDSWGTPSPFPERFDIQGTMDVTPWLCAAYAWHHIEDTVGWKAIRQDAASLLDRGSALVADALSGYVDDPLPAIGQPVGPMRLLRLPAPLGYDRASADGLRVPFMKDAGIAVAFTTFNGLGYLRLSAHAYNSESDFTQLATVGVPLLHRWSQDLSDAMTQRGISIQRRSDA